jgi:hypothetical protein
VPRLAACLTHASFPFCVGAAPSVGRGMPSSCRRGRNGFRPEAVRTTSRARSPGRRARSWR